MLLNADTIHLYQTMKWKIKQLIQGGFLFIGWIVMKTMDRYVGFMIWLSMLLIAFVAFTEEHVKLRVSNYLRSSALIAS